MPQLKQLGKKNEGGISSSSTFCSIQAFYELAGPPWGGPSALLIPWIQKLISSRNTLTNNPWPVKLIRIINHYGPLQFFSYSTGVPILFSFQIFSHGHRHLFYFYYFIIRHYFNSSSFSENIYHIYIQCGGFRDALPISPYEGGLMFYNVFQFGRRNNIPLLESLHTPSGLCDSPALLLSFTSLLWFSRHHWSHQTLTTRRRCSPVVTPSPGHPLCLWARIARFHLDFTKNQQRASTHGSGDSGFSRFCHLQRVSALVN